jgi:hypothetical protein
LAACGVVAVLIGGASACLDVRSASATLPVQFRWFVARPAPKVWKRLSLPSGGAVLSYPPLLVRTHSDSGSISVSEKDPNGRILLYLNATPKQSNERLTTWPTFRLRHNRDESDSVREDAHAFGLPFIGGKGSCVIDDYYSRVKVNHYREIACFVQGHTTASVIVAAALQSHWGQAAALLERAVSAYRVS